MGKRCQVCDGPIVNGRCKLCGMPYRNDEVLYHLNESSSDHYRHASNAAKQQMIKNQIPVADRQKAAREAQAARMKNPSLTGVNKNASAKKSSAGKTSRNVNYSAGRASAQKPAKRSKAGRWLVIILLVISLGAKYIPQGIDYIKSKIEYAMSGNIDTGKLDFMALLNLDTGVVEVESEEWPWVVPGLYVLEASNGNMTVELYRAAGGTEELRLHGDGAQVVVHLEKGDILEPVSAEDQYCYAELYLIEQNDE